MSLLDLDSRLFIIQNAMDSVLSYLRISNSINEKYMSSSYQKLLSLNLHNLKLNVDESKIIRMIQTSMREIEKGPQVDLRNPTLDAYIKKIVSNLEAIEEILDAFLLKKGIFNKCKNILFNDTFGSLYQFKIELLNRFNCEEIKVITPDNIPLDGLLIKADPKNILSRGDQSRPGSRPGSKPNSRPGSKPNSRTNSGENISNLMSSSVKELCLEKEKEKSLIIICGPNGASYEIFAYTDKWIEYYLDFGISVFLWNYRGYGESKGTVNYENMKSDAECVYEFMKHRFNFGKIGVHGISLGGIPACHLAGKNLVDFCYADRTFSSIEEIIRSYKYGNILAFIYSLFYFHDSNNTESFAKSNAVKIISSDPSDTIIDDFASLKTGISFKVIEDFKDNENFKSEKSESENIFSDDLLNIIIPNKIEYDEFYESFSYTIDKIKFYNYTEKEINVQVAQSSTPNASPRQDGRVENDYKNINTKESDVILTTDNKYLRLKDESKLKNFLEKFDAAGENVFTLTKYKSKNLRKKFLNIFFSNLFVWGSYKIGNVLASDKLISYRAVSKKFSLLNNKISKIINQPEKYYISDYKMINSLKSSLQYLIKIESNFNKLVFKNLGLNISVNSFHTLNVIPETSRDICFTEENPNSDRNNGNFNNTSEISMSMGADAINVENYRSAQLSDVIKDLNIGSLIPLKCGHNGLLSQEELELYSLYLLNSKFVT